MNVSPSQYDINVALRSFLVSILPSGNATFMGSAAGTTLIVASVSSGVLAVGSAVIGASYPPGVVISALGTGTGGVGTYTLSQAVDAKSQILSTTVPVVLGQINRVSEQNVDTFIVFWPLFRPRLATNQNNYDDTFFYGSIAGSVLTVAGLAYGSLQPGAPLLGTGLTSGSKVVKQLTGPPGGVGTYTITPAQTFTGVSSHVTAYAQNGGLIITAITSGTPALGDLLEGPNVPVGTFLGLELTGASSLGVAGYRMSNRIDLASDAYTTHVPLAAGSVHYTEAAECVYQIDVHGINSADIASAISTLFRSQFATRYFDKIDGGNIQVLHADEPRQIGFVNENDQWEWKWSIDAHLQANISTTVPQEFADIAEVGVIDVDAEYPA